MSDPTLRRLAWSLRGVSILLAGAGAYLQSRSGPNPLIQAESVTISFDLILTSVVLAALLLSLPATFLILLFPNGHVPSRRWRFVARLLAATIAFECLLLFVVPWESLDFPLSNPVGIDAIGDVGETVFNIGLGVLLLGMEACVILLLGLTYTGVVLTIQTVLPVDDDSPLVVAMVKPAHCSLWLKSTGTGA
ncbi:MAG: hypothetical protein ACRDJT_10655 [Actinomycetota bacterium]